MNPSEITSIKPFIDRMIADTQAGKIKWSKTSGTTFAWRVTGDKPEAQVSIQKTQQREVVPFAGAGRQIVTTDNFVFQATELPSGAVRVAINTQKDPEARSLLQALFEAISAAANREAVDFLKRIVESGQ
jgi:hypothetical protein